MARSLDPVKVAAWRERFVRFDSSELKTAEFCAAEGVSTASFYAWRRKLGVSQSGTAKNQSRTANSQPRGSRQPTQGAFQQVLIHSTPALAVRLPGGVEIEASGVDEQALRTIVSELVRAAREVETCAAEASPC